MKFFFLTAFNNSLEHQYGFLLYQVPSDSFIKFHLYCVKNTICTVTWPSYESPHILPHITHLPHKFRYFIDPQKGQIVIHIKYHPVPIVS